MNLPVEQQFYPEVVRVVSGDLTGSGFLLHPSEVGGVPGIGITNAHVLGNGSTPHIFPIYTDNERVPVQLIALSHEYDVAFFKIPTATMDILKRHLKEKYNKDEIPTFRTADVSQLKIGDRLTAIGHPLGFQHQEFSFGHFKGAQDFGNHPILYTDTELNGGNSGGAVVNQQREVVGIASLKMTGHNIDNLNGVRPIDEVKYFVPELMHILNAQNQQRVKLSEEYTRQMGAQRASVAASTAVRNIDDAFLAAFKDMAAGGKVRGEPRSFHIWCKRHIFDEDALHEGGAELLRYVMEHVHNDTVSELTQERLEKGGWVPLRESLTETSTSTPPMPEISFAAVELHLPQFGLVTHPLCTDGEMIHYGHTDTYTGGVMVSTVLPKSLYAQAQGQAGDIIHAVTINDQTHTLNWQGRAEPVPFGMTLSVDNLLKGAPYDANIVLHALRPNGETADVSFRVRAPTVEELPHVRHTYINTATGMMDAQQIIPVAGIKMGALRAQHVEAFQMASFMHPEKQYKFHAVILGVDTTSPAYGLLHKGMRVNKVGDEEVADTLAGFVEQLKTASTAPVFRINASHEFGTPVQFSVRVS